MFHLRSSGAAMAIVPVFVTKVTSREVSHFRTEDIKKKESIQISVALNTQELQYCRPLCVKDGLKTYGGYDGQI